MARVAVRLVRVKEASSQVALCCTCCPFDHALDAHDPLMQSATRSPATVDSPSISEASLS